MKRILMAFAALFLSGQALAETYVLPTGNWQTVGGAYTTDTQFSGSFTTAAPLPPNLAGYPVGPTGNDLVTSWTFTDGLFTFTKANSIEWGYTASNFRVSTDSQGRLTNVTLIVGNPTSGVQINDPVNAIVYFVDILPDVQFSYTTQAINQEPCTFVDTNAPEDVCGGASLSGDFAIAQGIGVPEETVPVPEPVPVGSPWALLLLALALLALAWRARTAMVRH